jgi:endonuclease G
MASLHEKLTHLRRYNAAVERGDPKLGEESRDVAAGLELLAVPISPEEFERQVELESIVMRRQRPVLAIRDNVTQLVFIDQADSEIWGQRLKAAKAVLDGAIPAVGRIELSGAPLDWVGTGWLVADNVIVTNRHVAAEFAVRNRDGFVFRMGPSQQISAAVDFLQEIENPNQLVFRLVKPLHIEEPPGPDVAFFEIEIVSGNAKLAQPINLASGAAISENVATIGYPAYDSRIAEPELMERIYGRVYNKKRLAPGGITRIEANHLWHNCTTLGGNSGSVVLDLTRGEAVGLHFSGSFLVTNYAVRADVVKKLLAQVRSGRPQRRPEVPPPPQPRPALSSQPGPFTLQRRASGSASLTLPLTLNISLSLDASRLDMPARPGIVPPPADDGTADFVAEAVSADEYRDRGGYDPAFLGASFAVELPTVARDADDVLDFELGGATQSELRYEHFSVLMSRSRRMCFVSACNIDGNLLRKSPRVAWKWDPRIPRSQQIMRECYGDPPKFSRGHMTRREDPGWGSPAVARRGNEDSMHVTNVTPQMQAFNAPIWLALEDYALQHAREDDMRISVFTGPYFADDDPEMYGVRIPLAFWKVIAFIHDETGELCATGYEMNQEQSLQPAEEFVFGRFISPQLGTATQVPIRRIETKSGIDFGPLADLDPLAAAEEGVVGAAPLPPLLALEQIRFMRS